MDNNQTTDSHRRSNFSLISIWSPVSRPASQFERYYFCCFSKILASSGSFVKIKWQFYTGIDRPIMVSGIMRQ